MPDNIDTDIEALSKIQKCIQFYLECPKETVPYSNLVKQCDKTITGHIVDDPCVSYEITIMTVRFLPKNIDMLNVIIYILHKFPNHKVWQRNKWYQSVFKRGAEKDLIHLKEALHEIYSLFSGERYIYHEIGNIDMSTLDDLVLQWKTMNCLILD